MIDDKQQLLNLVEVNKQTFKQYGADRLGLFGSFVRQEQTVDSDIDLLVEFAPGKKTYKNFIGFSNYAEKLFGRPVEVLTPQSLSPFIAPYINKEIEYVQIN